MAARIVFLHESYRCDVGHTVKAWSAGCGYCQVAFAKHGAQPDRSKSGLPVSFPFGGDKLNLIQTVLVVLLTCLGSILIAEPINAVPPLTVQKTALVTYPEWFCLGTEQAQPVAYVGYAFQINGRVRYFKTVTTCYDFPRSPFPLPSKDPSKMVMLGEQVILDDGVHPNYHKIVDDNPIYYTP